VLSLQMTRVLNIVAKIKQYYYVGRLKIINESASSQ
jgi:hypothetical protein